MSLRDLLTRPRTRVMWLVMAELAQRQAVDTELPDRIIRHTMGAFRPSLRDVKRATARLLELRFIEHVGATGILVLSDTGRLVANVRVRALRTGP